MQSCYIILQMKMVIELQLMRKLLEEGDLLIILVNKVPALKRKEKNNFKQTSF